MKHEASHDPEAGTGSESSEEPSDRSLLQRIRHGNQDAASVLYYRYAHRLRALVQAKRSSDLASRVDHEDIVQSVFKSFFRGVSRGSYDVPAGEELWHLFLVITLNKVRAKGVFHRAAKRDVRLTVGDDEIDGSSIGLKSNHDAYLLLKMAVEEALDRLPAQHKLVTQLRMEGDDVAEIARKTGRSKRSVERILQECREKLSYLLGER
jgi:RNA polymerase sigma-70 factor, ECF subfamily